MQAHVTTMVKDGIVYAHDTATVGHKEHTAECWTIIIAPLGFDWGIDHEQA
jgi:hypothetical protein